MTDENGIDELLKRINEKIDNKSESYLIIKQAVIGYLLLKVERNDGSKFISTQPLMIDDEGCDDGYECQNNEKIIGILPATQETYQVLGILPEDHDLDKYPDNGSYKEIGFEFKGASHPDWKQEIKDRIEYKLRHERGWHTLQGGRDTLRGCGGK